MMLSRKLAGWICGLLLTALPPGMAGAAQNLCVIQAGTPATAPQPARLDGAAPYVFKSVGGEDLRIHVFSPTPGRTTGKSPAIVFYFGGAWMTGTVTEFIAEARYFSDRGATVILAEYRTFCRSGAGIVDEMTDAKDAMRWVRRHADELGVDPNCIAVSGASSGGHLALSTAMFKDLDPEKGVGAKPNLLVLFYPCVDETTQEEHDYGGDAIGSHGKDVSPLYHVAAGLPPMIIFQGSADSLYAENKTFCERAAALGNQCRFVEYKDAPHGFSKPSASGGKWYLPVLIGMDDFLAEAGYLSPLAAIVPPGRP